MFQYFPKFWIPYTHRWERKWHFSEHVTYIFTGLENADGPKHKSKDHKFLYSKLYPKNLISEENIFCSTKIFSEQFSEICGSEKNLPQNRKITKCWNVEISAFRYFDIISILRQKKNRTKKFRIFFKIFWSNKKTFSSEMRKKLDIVLNVNIYDLLIYDASRTTRARQTRFLAR